jgi:Ca2+-dependent lipid-binding protein
MQGSLIIRPLQAQLNFSTEWFGKMDVYCKFTIGSQVFKSQSAHDQDKRPTWQDAITVNLKGEQSMHVALYDHDNLTRDDYLCETMVNLAEVCSRGNFQN